jgi:hypothetical protein
MSESNCCRNLNEVVEWFKKLKSEGVQKDEILDVLEFDSDQYPDLNVLKQAREIVYLETV